MKYPTKSYFHFDKPIKYEIVESYITSSEKIAKHSFLPFIHYIFTFDKYYSNEDTNNSNRPIKSKNREIMYAGHLDNFIYKYYADNLNNVYNIYCKEVGIDDCVIAYRNNKPGKSNVDFAAESINRIVTYKEAFIFIGDFTNYFDRIDHAFLKDNLKKVLKVSKLPQDWFNIYKSITKYGFYDKKFIEKKVGREKYLKSEKKNSYFNTIKSFRMFQKNCTTKHNKEKFGIPQGVAISSVFANIYALSFDLSMNKIAEKHQGMYRRYSDDIILIIPANRKMNVNEFQLIETEIRKLAKINKIYLKKEKTSSYIFKDNTITNLLDKKIHHLDYLGFVFDGNIVKMRNKSVYKFYRKAKNLVKHAQKRKAKNQLEKLPYRKQIYKLYTDMGKEKRGRNSFIDYAKKSQAKFDLISPNTKNVMMNQISNRKKKIEKFLGTKIHTKIS
ncbi:reverse transcriptase domain-containing protein [Staphylococcus coagulans]|uniref:reverse transcriptase domain-containing protein n=1 Tax=Staphylococcus coagulans TaxID=74706 RepID=UPI0015F901C1|nr:reverse transcriptase domain-containing protein [Staphylococcus coagulans]MBA8764360.1 RNA-dependent DNA polymerase [Staphylococcus coagulans]MBT2809820.1 RNA-dependent DNA polymerase [Staphylococcus coagulans]MBT2811962.1 RNA-dependent DNA polymerase [Staphylococcus coagulans]MBT2818928.1 RNA-dependent DNA polymerase [Staphylococcus coagulans]MBT2821300.1 RNA-dependent DNA polymerase [Staphylococcus coagulans]